MSEWINIEPAELFISGQARLVDLGDVQIAVFNINGEYHAIEDNCSHDNSPLLGCDLETDQLLDGEQIICPRHGARFCIKTGKALTAPAYEDVPVFPVQITDGIVQTRDNRWD
jgi:3-phenylpropionate/trans-cinnamate dioxygenase ferredoxin subunit